MLTRTWQTPSMFRDEVDRSVLWGFGVSGLLVGGAILLSGHLTRYFDIPGLLLVLGGIFGATLANYSMRELGYAWKAFLKVAQHQPSDPIERIDRLVRLSQTVRAQGVMVLEREAEYTKDQPGIFKPPAVPKFYTALGIGCPYSKRRDIRNGAITLLPFTNLARPLHTIGNIVDGCNYPPNLAPAGVTIVRCSSSSGALDAPVNASWAPGTFGLQRPGNTALQL